MPDIIQDRFDDGHSTVLDLATATDVEVDAWALLGHEDALARLIDGYDHGNERRAGYDPSLHPRGPHGRFRSTADRIRSAIRKHIESGGKDGDPLKDFTPEQLRRVARLHGLTIKRGEDRASVTKKLIDAASGYHSPQGMTIIPAPKGTEVRDVLQNTKTIEELNRAAAAEAGRLSGRHVEFAFLPGHDTEGHLQVSREHAEGVLRGLERFPHVNLRRVSDSGDHIGYYAETVVPGEISFNLNHSDIPYYTFLYRDALKKDAEEGYHTPHSDSPVWVGVHEFGHIVDALTLGERIHADADRVWHHYGGNHAAGRGAPGEAFPVSGYGATRTSELVAEAFTDVMTNGDQASAPSKEIYGLLVTEYNRGRARRLPVEENTVRPTLQNAKTLDEINHAATVEALHISGEQIPFSFAWEPADLDIARQHAEGVLRGLELFPEAGRYVSAVTDDHLDYPGIYATTDTADGLIRFNSNFTLDGGGSTRYRKYIEKDVETGFHPANYTPITVGFHEFVHVVDLSMMGGADHAKIAAIWRRYQGDGGDPDFDYPARLTPSVSGYADRDTNELVAEAIADVEANGDKASEASREIYDVFVTEYDNWAESEKM